MNFTAPSIAEVQALASADKNNIRVTPEGWPSVLDTIRVLGGQKNPRQVWQRLLEKYPYLSEHVIHFKFPGRGQRETPVLADLSRWLDFASCALADPISERDLIHKSNPKAPITERNIQVAYAAYFSECDASTKQYVPCSSGVADIVTSVSVIEVKEVKNWKCAIGQAIVYASDFGLLPEVALFGDANYEPIVEKCTALRVGCYGVPIKKGDALRFLQGLGPVTYHNNRELSQLIAQDRQPCQN